MTTTTTENAAVNTTGTDGLEGDYIPHNPDPGMDDFSNAVIESSEPAANPDLDNASANLNADNSDDNDDTEGDAQVTDPAQVFKFGDTEYSTEAATPETPREKELREQLEALQKQTRTQAPATSEPLPELVKPGMYDEGIGGDPEKYEAAMLEYGKELGKRESQQQQQQQAQEQRRQQDGIIYEQNVKNYDTRRAAVKSTLPDIDLADAMLSQALPQMHQASLMCAGVENPEMVAYALYKDKTLRDKFAQEQNPVRLGMMIADISKKAQLAPKGAKPKVNREPQVNGSQGTTSGNGLPKEFASAKFE